MFLFDTIPVSKQTVLVSFLICSSPHSTSAKRIFGKLKHTTRRLPQHVLLASVEPQQEGQKEDSTKLSDYEFAEKCMEGGCPVEDVQELLVRLEERRKALQKEIDVISQLMSKLARYNASEERGLLKDVVLAAFSIFSRSENNYPEIGESSWTMDPYRPKKWQD
eukprot:jgi/Galph1/1686/GphlegSOOS_G375.1